MVLLILFELLVVLELMCAAIDALDGVEREKVQDVILIHLDRHRERLFKHEIEAMRFLNELDAAIGSIFLHSQDEHLCFLGGVLNLVSGLS